MVFRGIIYVYSEKHNKDKIIPCGKNKEIMNGKVGGILYCVGLRSFVLFGMSLTSVQFCKADGAFSDCWAVSLSKKNSERNSSRMVLMQCKGGWGGGWGGC